VVALVLLIACERGEPAASRATVRQRKVAVRLSLGATRRRLVRQLLTESLLLAAAGGALGLLVGYWGRQLLPGPPGQASYLDWQVFVFVLTVTVVTGVVFGIAPALRATGGDASAALKQTSRSVAGTRSLLGRSLLVVQVALSLVLIVGAGLFLRTLYNLRHVDVGFNPENLLLFRVAPELNRYDEKRSAALVDQLLERIGRPGVRPSLTNPALLRQREFDQHSARPPYAASNGTRDSINRWSSAGLLRHARSRSSGPRLHADTTARRGSSRSTVALPCAFPGTIHRARRRASSGQQEIVGICATRSTTASGSPRRRRCTTHTSRGPAGAGSSPCGRPSIRQRPRARCGKRSGRSIPTCP
jgi:hypothetical protein